MGEENIGFGKKTYLCKCKTGVERGRKDGYIWVVGSSQCKEHNNVWGKKIQGLEEDVSM